MHTAILTGGFILAWGMVLAVGFLIWKTGSAKVWQANAEGQQKRAEESERKYEELMTEHKKALTTVGDLKRINERLEALPNLQKVIEFMSREREKADEVWTERTKEVAAQIIKGIAKEIDEHECEATERHLEVMKVLKEKS